MTVDEVDEVLAFIQTLDPAGVGARSVSECIALQLAQLDPQTPGRDLAVQIAREHLQDVADRELTGAAARARRPTTTRCRRRSR